MAGMESIEVHSKVSPDSFNPLAALLPSHLAPPTTPPLTTRYTPPTAHYTR
jgi:hypothetical protein